MDFEEVLDNFIAAIKRVSVRAADGYKVVHTPLNGTGMELVTRILKEIGCMMWHCSGTGGTRRQFPNVHLSNQSFVRL